MADIDELKRLRDEVNDARQRIRKLEKSTPAPAPPKTPVQELEDAVDQIVGPAEERDYDRGPRKPELGPPPPPPTKWWMDADERGAIRQRAAEISASPPLRGQIGALEQAGFGVPPQTGMEEILEDVGRREQSGIPGIGVPPPGFEMIQPPKSPREALSEYGEQIQRRWGGPPQLGPEPEPITGDFGGRWAAEGLTERAEQEYTPYSATGFLGQLKRIPGVGGVISTVEAATHGFFTGLANLDYLAKMGIGHLAFRTLRSGEELRDTWDAQNKELLWANRVSNDPLGSRDLSFDDYVQEQETNIDNLGQVYDLLHDPELSETEQGSLTHSLSRYFWSGPEAWIRGIDRLKKGEDPDVVVAEEMDPIREMVGEFMFSLDWPAGMAFGWLKEARTLSKVKSMWTAPVVALPGWMSGAGKSRKGILEQLVPWSLTRGAKRNILSNLMGNATAAIIGKYGDDVDSIRAAFRGLQDEGGFKLFMEGINAHSDSEGAKAVDLLVREKGFADEIVGLLKGRVRGRDLVELGEEAKSAKVFDPGEFLSETESLATKYADDIFDSSLDLPKNAASKAMSWVNNGIKSRLSDVWMGLNPGYGFRNAYNNFATLGVDNLIDGYSFFPNKKADFLDLWFGKEIRPAWMTPGLGGTPAQPARTAAGEMVDAGKRGGLPIHRFAAWNEDWSRTVATVTQLRRWGRKQWNNMGGMFPQTLRKHIDIDPDIEHRLYQAVSDNLGSTDDDIEAARSVLKAYGGADELIEGERRLAPRVRQWVPEDAEPRDFIVDEAQRVLDDFAADGDLERLNRRASGIKDDLRTEYMTGRGHDGMVPNTKHQAWQLVDSEGVMPHTADMPTPYYAFPGNMRRLEEDVLGWTMEAKRRVMLETLADVRKTEPHLLDIPEAVLPWTHMHDVEKWTYSRRVLEEAREAGYKVNPVEEAYLADDVFKPMYRSPDHVPNGPLRVADLDDKAQQFMRGLGDKTLGPDSTIDNAWIAKNIDFSDIEYLPADKVEAAAEQVGERLYQFDVVNSAWTTKGTRNVQATQLPGQIDYTTLTRERARITNLKNSAGGEIHPSARGLEEWYDAKVAFYEGKTTSMPVFEDYISPLKAEEIADYDRVAQLAEDRKVVDGLAGQKVVDQHVEVSRRLGELDMQIGALEDEARALPTIQETRPYRNLKTGEVITSPKTQAGKGTRKRMPWDMARGEWEEMGVPTRSYGKTSVRGKYTPGEEEEFTATIDRVWEIRDQLRPLKDERFDLIQAQKELPTVPEGQLDLAMQMAADPEGQLKFYGDLEKMAGEGKLAEADLVDALAHDRISMGQADELRGIKKGDVAGAAHSTKTAEFNAEMRDAIAAQLRKLPEEEQAARMEALGYTGAAGESMMRLVKGADVDFMGIHRPAPYGTYQSDMLESVIEGEIRFIDAVMEQGPPNITVPPNLMGKGGEGLMPAVEAWLRQDVAQAKAAMKMSGEAYAKAGADFALLDYGRRHNLDLWTALVMPYPFWRTWTGVNWAQRAFTKPWAFNAVTGVRDAMRDLRSDMPTRLKDAGVEIETPWLAEQLGDWAGDSLMFDPMRLLFAPFETWPASSYLEPRWDDPADQENALQSVTAASDAMQMRPYPHIGWAMKLLSGEGLSQEYNLFSQSGALQGLTAILWEKNIGREGPELDATFLPQSIRDALGWGDTVEIELKAGGIQLEAAARRLARGFLGQTEYELPSTPFYNEYYWPIAHMAFMVEEGEITKNEFEEAKHDRFVNRNEENEIWQTAYNRAAIQKGVPSITGFLLGQRWKMYPAAEERIRATQDELRDLGWAPDRPYGSAAERREFREERPELSARSELFGIMPPSAWLYKRYDGSTDIEALRQDTADWEAEGGIPGVVEHQYRLHEYYKGSEALDLARAKAQNELLKGGMVPGTKGYRVVDRYLGGIENAHYEKFADLWDDYEASVPFKASPAERVAWLKNQRARDLANVYYNIEAENYADEEGEVDWDAWGDAQEAALATLPPEERLEVERYIYKSWIPEEEAMAAVEDTVYSPLMDLIGAIREAEEEDREELQDELDELEAGVDDAAVDALVEALDEIMARHPDWGEEEVARVLGFAVPSFEAWQRSFKDERAALESAFENFYWGLDKGTRRGTRDEEWAEKQDRPGNYLGIEFEEFYAENKKLENLGDISDEQLLQWLAQTGQLTMLEAEGFPIPGEPLRGVFARIPGYEERVEGEEYDLTGIEGTAGARARRGRPAPAEAGTEVAPVEAGTPTKTERLAEQMREAAVAVAVQGEEQSEIELVDPTFQLADEAVLDEMTQAYAEMDAYWAAKDAGEEDLEWSPIMEKWFGDPDSPESLFWKTYGDWRAPKEGNPMGWGLLPVELKENPFVKMVLDAVGEDEELDETAYLEARLAMEEYIAEHGEELVQAREELVGYLAALDPAMEELQDQYYDLPKGERRDFLVEHPDLDSYWEMKRAYKAEHPMMVKYYFPPKEGETAYQPRRSYGGGGGRRGKAAPSEQTWAAFLKHAGSEVAGTLIDYWSGRGDLAPAAKNYLQSLFKANSYGASSFELWLDVLRKMWQQSLPTGEYEIPMRKHGVIVKPDQYEGYRGTPRPPTRVRYLG